MRRVIALIVVIVMVSIILRRESPVGSTPAVTSANPSAIVPANASAPTTKPNSAKGFRDRAHFDEHFAKHGGEFAGLSKAQYLAAAQTLRDAPAGGDVLEIVRTSDGVVSRFDKRSGAFLAFDRDGTIRTFFKPNDGERYFRRQANRAPSP